MVSSELLRSCAMARSSFASSAGILLEASAIAFSWTGTHEISSPRSQWFDSRRQPVDINVVPSEKGTLPIFFFFLRIWRNWQTR